MHALCKLFSIKQDIINKSTGWVKKSVICVAWCKPVPFLCNYPVWWLFIYFLKICNFFLVLQSLKIKSSEKQKCAFILFSLDLKFFKDWITESQKMCKIVIRKFAIFSSATIFTEKLFFNGSYKVSTEQRVFNTLEY